MHLIETRDLCYVYPGKVTALNNINFIAPRNARIAVIGSNGAGKSTLFKHFNGIFKPTSGSVLIRGEPITKQNTKEIRKFVGIVFQNPTTRSSPRLLSRTLPLAPPISGLIPRPSTTGCTKRSGLSESSTWQTGCLTT